MNQRHLVQWGSLVAVLFLVSTTLISTASADPPDWPPQQLENSLRDDDEAILQSKRVTWPEPVRQARYVDGLHSDKPNFNESNFNDSNFDEPVVTLANPARETDEIAQAGMADVFAEGDAYRTPVPTHQVINSPTRQEASKQGSKQRSPNHPLHPNYRLHHQVQAPPATLPEGKQRETWKTPYSYGYFGASSTRSWSLHTGYRDRYTEWRLR